MLTTDPQEAKACLREGRFEEAAACLHLIEEHASIGREGLGGLTRSP